MEAAPTLFDMDSELGDMYYRAMKLAGRYAYAGRDHVMKQVLDILGAESTFEVHNHHNYAWREEHGGESWWVVRKGCTPAFPGQRGFVGSTMGEESVILEGTDEAHRALFSTVHGAGRVMSRMEAAGRRRRRWTCNNRDCDWTQPPREAKPNACPKCGNKRLAKRWVQLKDGKIDFDAVRRQLQEAGIELRGGAADEAPAAYKRLDAVLADHGDTIRVIHRLRPVGVAMAGPDVFDPYKD